MRSIITTNTIKNVVAGNVGRVVVVTRGDERAHFTAAPRSSHARLSDASYRASWALGCEHLMRVVGTVLHAAHAVAALAQQALSWLDQPAKRPMPARAAKALRGMCHPATGLHRNRG
jgi:hypothetical protein